MAKFYPVETLDHDKPIVYYPPRLGPLPAVRKAAFGSASMDAAILPHPEENDSIGISKTVLEGLHIPEGVAKFGIFLNEDTLFLGPLIGIFTSNLIDSSTQPAGERTNSFSKLLDTCGASGASGFLFTGQGIDWEKNLVKGYFFSGGSWESRLVPFPNVVYDRLPTRKSESRPESKLAKERLQKDYLIPWFNPGFFNKLDIFERLKENRHAEKYLPETHLFTSVTETRRLLDKHGSIYLKPIHGTLGIGIRQVIAEFPGSTCYCRFRDQTGSNKLLKFNSLHALTSKMFGKRGLKNILIQQRILLLKVGGRPVDFRVHTNKDGKGKWQVSAIAGKQAGFGSITTHVRNGGDVHTLKELFGEKDAVKYERKLSEAALELSEILEERLEGISAEFGFDFGIDRDGIVWLFEVNSKPGRSIFHHRGMRKYEYLTRKLPIDYAIHLAEKSVKAPEEIYH
ncbi:YheC/YheD family protein [Neobacillus piezotolerans]|uniref:YheC/YheD family protein n=1 Tax=Neobacillus piezotolerans TaxID=2259171 RepID=A0A3D8GLN8_9BACI|nr:YheC/YheD family protein [Neobacillus piezotolerans]RDU35318.1 YheC/YheD family protein [Neobacillus piezotolerans]